MPEISKTYAVKGMHCASCAGIIEKTVKKLPGIKSIEVNVGTEKALIVFDDTRVQESELTAAIRPLGYEFVIPATQQTGAQSGVDESKIEKKRVLDALKNKVISVIPLACVSAFVMGWEIFGQLQVVPEMTVVWKEFFHHLMPLIATYTLFVVGKPYLVGVWRFLRTGSANMDTLIGIGTTAAFFYSFVLSAFEETLLASFPNVEYTYFDVTIIVIAFITLGKYLEMRAKEKTGDAIQKLLSLQVKTALVLRDGTEQEIPIEQVVQGDLIIVKPAGKIPVDGVITEGESYVDESMITGEPVPVHKIIGGTVAAGTINASGSFTFRATKVGSETLLASIIKMVEEAQGTKAPIQALADKISSIFVPIVLVLAVVALGAWLLIGTPYLGFSQALSYGILSCVGILVIACPCALGLATPTAIIVGVGKGAKEGILIKDARTLEMLHRVSVVVVDKTGTITKGKPELVSIANSSSKSDDEILGILASLEKKSEHPLAHALVMRAQEKNISLSSISDFEALQGLGLRGKIGRTEYFAGSTKLCEQFSLSYDRAFVDQQTLLGMTPIILATREKMLGIFMVADTIKSEAKAAVSQLHALGVKVVMLTGDTENTAKYIAQLAGIDDVVAHVSPGDKLKKIQELQAQGAVVAMAGDGVNDAPALAQADVGIAMATGTDVAIESAGITLLHGDISKLVKAIRLSKFTMRGIKQNLFWAFAYNVVGIPIAGGVLFPFFGILLNPIFAGLAMALSSVSVVGNSLRLKSMKL